MKLLWLCNMVPGKVKEAVSGGSTGGGLWVDSVLEGLLEREGLNIRILCPGDGSEGNVNERCSYAFFSEGLPYVYLTELETQFRGELDTFQPDVIHVWGTEYGHTLAMVNAAEKAGRWDVSSETGEKTLGLCPPKEEVISGEELVRRIFHWENIDSAAWDKLYHRSLFASARYPLGVICEDVPTTYRIALDAGQAAMLPCPVYNYYHRPGSITSSSVSEKTFHFSRHTAEIYPFIRDNYPGIADAARYLRVRSLAYNLLTLDLANKDTRQKFADEYRLSR